MTRICRIASLTALLVLPGLSAAGLYNPAEPREGQIDPDYRVFSSILTRLRNIGIDPAPIDSPLRMRYFLIADSAPRFAPPSWPLDRQISLSAYLIRRLKTLEAIELLKPLARREPNNFLIAANLGTAYQLSGQEPRSALDYIDQATRAWPKSWNAVPKDVQSVLTVMGWEPNARNPALDPLHWYREAEIYHLKLLHKRLPEAATKGKMSEQLDDLFGVRFVGDSGKYEAGKLAAKEKAKLPVNALALVQQLLIWLPDDPRLFWLLGELYNANGDVATALQILDSPELGGLNGRFRPAELRDHLRILKSAPAPAAPEIIAPPDVEKTPQSEPVQPVKYLDIRALLVGFGVGVAFSFMFYWQVREILRRRRARTNAGPR